MNMFATQGGVVELWVTKTDTYTSTKTGEIYASVQSIAPIPEGARGNAKGFEISEYNI
ncbi:DNA-binding protein, partial [Pseudomonas aeruginosa]